MILPLHLNGLVHPTWICPFLLNAPTDGQHHTPSLHRSRGELEALLTDTAK